MILPGLAGRLWLDDTDPEALPLLRWGAGHPGTPALIEHSHSGYTRPGLRGHRPDGSAWSTRFRPTGIEQAEAQVSVTAVDPAAGLNLRTEFEALPGGAARARHVLGNVADSSFWLQGLSVSIPVPDHCTELLDFTGRHEGERRPQSRPITDGLWLREARGGRPGLDSATMLVAGTAGFGFDNGFAVGIALGFSGNAEHSCQRSGASGPVLAAGELLLPGELSLEPGREYATPWVYLVAGEGLDELAAQLHAWQRSLPAHPVTQPVTLNVWEAVYFEHDPATLTELAERAAGVGVERFVLDDGWFHGRRHDRAGLGDWWVDEQVWPAGLGPLAERVTELGMQFGLWFEPEMVNPDSEFFRRHPDWVLQTSGRLPELERNQLVADLTNPAAWSYLHDRMAELLARYPISYVKWDHNRQLLDAGSPLRHGAPAVHGQTLAFYALLDRLSTEFPEVAWESCASGGGRIDLGVIERVQRFWTSDLTDARQRQQIQRWTVQLVAPEYLGAHISAPTSHQTGRTLPLDFRALTAFFFGFGIEWDLTAAGPADLARLRFWCRLHQRYRPLLHNGRTVRIDTADPVVIGHAVLAPDRGLALLAMTTLDESGSNRGVAIRLPGLAAERRYELTVLAGHDDGLSGRYSGAQLATSGVWLPRQRPETGVLCELVS